MSKGLLGHMGVSDPAVFAIGTMDKNHVQGLDMKSKSDQDGLSLLVFAVTIKPLEQESECHFPH